MAAILTDRLKLKIVDDIVKIFEDTTNPAYIGFARSEQWDSTDTAPAPLASLNDERNFNYSLQSIKRISAVSTVVPRVNWTNGTIYHQWDDKTSGYGTNSFYVLTENFSVYICLRSGRNAAGQLVPSTVQPTGSNNDPFVTADGYVWKFLYTISEIEARRFMTAGFMPTKVVTSTDSNSTGIELKQEEIQNTADPRRITSVVVENGGTGYTSAPNIFIRGDGDSNFSLTATINGGVVTKIEFDADSSTLKYAAGYTKATVDIIGGGGSGAKARAIIGPTEGFGKNSKLDLKSSALVLHSKVEGADSDFILGNDFRQIGILSHAKKIGSDSTFTALTGLVLNHMTLSATSQVFSADKKIVGATSGAKAFIDKVDSNLIFFHQTPETGFDSFSAGETLTESNGTGNGVIGTPLIKGEVEPHSHQLLYLNNRGAIERSATQSEDIKIIIQL